MKLRKRCFMDRR